MGRKNIVYDFKPIVNADMSEVEIIGKESNVAQFDTVTYDFNWSGGAATNAKISIEFTKDEHEPKTWNELDFGASIEANGPSGNHRLIITEVGFRSLRPKITRLDAGASGIINASVFATNKGA